LGTAESNERMQVALDQLWPYAQQLFEPLAFESLLVEEQIMPPIEAIYEEWQGLTTRHLQKAGLTIPTYRSLPASKRTQHTEQLTILLNEMQSVARLDPEAQW
jgi:ring-1,2-phenylacetyl-CoA epoxidase subunit PaaC